MSRGLKLMLALFILPLLVARVNYCLLKAMWVTAMCKDSEEGM